MFYHYFQVIKLVLGGSSNMEPVAFVIYSILTDFGALTKQ